MNPWEFFGLSPEEYEQQMAELGYESLDEKLDKFFAKAQDAPRYPPCKHDWVNMGFMHVTMVCKKCDKEKPHAS